MDGHDGEEPPVVERCGQRPTTASPRFKL